MFERFTDRARRVVVLAQEEARMLNHNYIGTEHILLGLIHEGEGVAAKSLENLGISLDAVREQVQEIIGQGQQAPSGHITFPSRAKKVLELSLREELLRDEEKMPLDRKIELEQQWKSDNKDIVAEVDRERLAEVVADLLGEPEVTSLTGDASGATGGARLQAHLGASLTTGHATAFEELLTDQLRVLGPDHPDTLDHPQQPRLLAGEAGGAAGAATASRSCSPTSCGCSAPTTPTP